MTLKDELFMLVGTQYATREEWRNNFRKNEEMEPKQKKKNNQKQKTNTHLWMGLVIEARSDAVKSNIA